MLQLVTGMSHHDTVPDSIIFAADVTSTFNVKEFFKTVNLYEMFTHERSCLNFLLSQNTYSIIVRMITLIRIQAKTLAQISLAVTWTGQLINRTQLGQFP